MSDVEVTIRGKESELGKLCIPEDMTFEELKNKYIDDAENPVVLALFKGRLRELCKHIRESGEVEFLRASGKDGRRTYWRSTTFLMQRAIQSLWGNKYRLRVWYSFGQCYYCELEKTTVTEEMLAQLKKKMQEMVAADLRIEKNNVKTEKAEQMFGELGMKDKERLLHYRRSSRTNLYTLDGLQDYHYGYMVPSTGYLRLFDLQLYEEGFLLLFPNREFTKVDAPDASIKHHTALKTARDWSRMLGVGTVGALNDAIAAGRGQEIVLLQEALMEERIGKIADRIAQDRSKKFVMIAGPSSSGKTTFANRLSIQLSAKGLIPHPIGLDDYYSDREFCPKNPDGSYDFECLEALDVEQFNRDMMKLLAGEAVSMPSFNFKTGKREYRGKRLQLGEEDILVIEGIHGLNDKLSHMIPDERKFRVYISALTQINIDEHNPLSTTDGRLIRRIVRDARTRGTNARETIAMWGSVRRGEELHIFPHQDRADEFFNSALLYEPAVLKVYAEPLLFQIPRDCPEYLEAKRLLKFLDYFLPLPTEGIAQNSLMREFVGGSCFNV